MPPLAGRHGLCAVALVALVARAAPADESEASLVLEAGPAFLRVGELHDTGATTIVPGGGGALALTYGVSDLLTVDLAVGGALARNAEYHDQMIDETTRGNVLQDALSVRVMTGVTLRFGARLIPTIGAHVGYQRHVLGNAVLFRDPNIGLRSFRDRAENDVLFAGGLGLELRLDRHWLVGLSAQLSYGLGLGGNSLVAIELPFRVSYAFYPGWLRSTRVTRFED